MTTASSFQAFTEQAIDELSYRRSKVESAGATSTSELLSIICSQLDLLSRIQLELLKHQTGPSGLGLMPPEG